MKRGYQLFMLAVAVLFIVSMTGCSKEEAVIQEAAVPVAALEIQPDSLSNQVTIAGEIASNEEVLISTKIPGKIRKIYVEVGDQVKAGELLFELENEDLKAAVEQAEQNLSMAQANLNKVRNGARPQEIEQVNQAVNQAKIQLDLTQTNFDRMKELFEAEAISQQQYDQALSQLEIAEAAYKSALEQQSLVKEGASEDDIRAAEAQVGLAQANVKMAEAKWKDTMIYSPIEGSIGFIKFDVGEFVMQGNPVVQVIDDKNMVVKIDLSEANIGKIKRNDKVQVKIPSASDHPYEGTVTEISPAADSRTKSYPVEISINNPNGEIKSGMTASVIFAMEKKENIISVPVGATFEEAGEYYIYRIVDNKAEKTKIKIGINDGKRLEVTQGLEIGDYVIVQGHNQVQDGDVVRVTKGGRSQ